MASGSENTTNRVYIASQEFGWLPAKIKSTSGTKAVVEIKDYEDDTTIPACEVSGSVNPTSAQKKRGVKNIPVKELEVDLTGKSYSGGVLPLQNVDEDGKLIEVEDMVDLSFLHEAAILYNLKARHSKGIPYTRTGDIVIAVNPYQWINELYSEEVRGLYTDKLVWNGTLHQVHIRHDYDYDYDYACGSSCKRSMQLIFPLRNTHTSRVSSPCSITRYRP